MELQGKKVVFLGDSITEGTGATDVEHRYTNVFARLADCEIFVDGIGGTRIARQTIPTNERWDKDFNGRADALPDDADIVVVFGGTNDFGHGDAPLGTFGDETVYTFYGALRVLCEKLIAKYPYATIVFMTPLHRATENATVNKFGQPTPPLIEYVKAIRQVCEQYSLPVLDLFKVSGMQPSVEIIQQTYMPDGLHPSNAGAEKIAKLLYQFLRNF